MEEYKSLKSDMIFSFLEDFNIRYPITCSTIREYTKFHRSPVNAVWCGVYKFSNSRKACANTTLPPVEVNSIDKNIICC